MSIINEEYAARLKRDREWMWRHCDKHKARIDYPMHPDEEIRFRNDWLMCKNIEDIISGHNFSESYIEKCLNDYSILFYKRILHPYGTNKTVRMIEIPAHDGTKKIITEVKHD